MARVAELVDSVRSLLSLTRSLSLTRQVWQDWFIVLTDFNLQLHSTAPVRLCVCVCVCVCV
jgi:hypothetical protein